MAALAVYIVTIITVMLVSPKTTGRWLSEIKKAYDDEMRK